jgi:hypothetical protein
MTAQWLERFEFESRQAILKKIGDDNERSKTIENYLARSKRFKQTNPECQLLVTTSDVDKDLIF